MMKGWRSFISIGELSIILVSAGFAHAGITVPGIANPYLAGQPDGTTANSGDVAPTNSPVQVTTIPINPGDVLSFVVTGSTNNDPGPSGLTPDGCCVFSRASEHGLAGYTTALNSLMAVFLDDAVPDGAAPADFTFAPNNSMFSPGLRQPFFIGDGLTGNGDGSGERQKFVVPAGATRLFLASADGCCWNNNFGSFDVEINRSAASSCAWAVGEWHQGTNGHYYSVQAISGSEYSWPLARAQARALIAPNGRSVDLATLTSAEENAFVFAGIDCPDYWAIDGAGNNEGPNLGGFQRDKNSEAAGSWAWVTGEPWVYTNWSSGEPNNSSGIEDFLTFFAVGNARSPLWNDISSGTGSVVKYYVAESVDEQPCAAVPAGLVSWWQADGNTLDAAGGNNGTIQGAVTFVNGKVGQAFELGGHGDTNGTGDRVRVTNTSALQVQNFTIDAWIRRSSSSIVTNNGKPGVEGGTFFAFGNGGYGFLIDQATNRLVLTRVQVSNVKSSGTIVDTNYHHVAVTKSGSQVVFYIDGVPAGTAAYDPGFTFTTDPAIGARGDNDVENAFLGNIDELQIFNRALSAAEIQAIFNAGGSGECSSCVEPPAGMVAWLPGDGNGSDISGHGNNGALLNGAGFAPGMVGQAFSFDGVDDVVDIPDSSSLDFPNAPFTVEMWAYRTSTSPLQHLLGKRNNCTGSNTEGNYQLGWNSAGGGHYFFGNPGGPETAAPADFPLNTWVHIAGTFDGSNYRLYINGELIQTVPGTTGPVNDAPLRLGNSGSCEPFGGRLDEVEVFNRALSQPEIQSIFRAGGSGQCRECVPAPSGLTMWLAGDGNAFDRSGHDNSGTLVNGASFGPGLVEQAFAFDGVDDQVVVPHNPNQNVGSGLTVDAWVYPASLGHGKTIIQKRSASNIGGYVFETAAQPFATDNSLQFVIMIGGVYHFLGTGAVLTPNAWQHVAATYDGAMMRIFVNGIEVASMPQTGAIDSTTDPVVIGRNVATPSFAWQGMIDEVELFNRALSPSEIQGIVNAGSAGKCPSCVPAPPNLVGWYPGDGNATDLSSISNHATLHGGAAFASGIVGQAFELNGTDAFVQAPALSVQDPTTAGSLDAWVYLYQTPAQAGHDMSIIVKGGSTTDFNLQVFGDRFYFQIAANVNVSSTTIVQSGRWYHVAGTWDSAVGLKIYVDGVLENTNSTSVTRNPSGQPFTIGHDPIFGPRLFHGLIDEAEVFNRALTASEIQGIFSAREGGKCKSPPIELRITSISRPRTGNAVSSHVFIAGQTEPGLTVRIQAASNLQNGFTDLGTVTADRNGIFHYDVGSVIGLTRRFYRAVYP